jgi:hypothetical protein
VEKEQCNGLNSLLEYPYGFGKMNKEFVIIIALLALGLKGLSQAEYAGKLETGYLKFLFNTIKVDPGPDWKGYNLDEEDAMELNLVNGIKFRDKCFSGIGVGYLNFEGINGISVFSDFEYLLFRTALRPVIRIKFGYNHIWNQYENGTGSVLGELALGLNYKLTEKLDIYLQSGFAATQQSLLIPIRIGLGF